MTKIIVIVGPNGVGKSTTAEALLKMCSNCAYIDAEWCRAINPFKFTESTKQAVVKNIYCLFRNYIVCKDINTIVFPYGFHGERKEIFDTVMSKLSGALDFDLHIIVLKCSLEENVKRAQQDNRDNERIKNGIENTFLLYEKYQYPCIDTTNLSPKQVADEIIAITKTPNFLNC